MYPWVKCPTCNNEIGAIYKLFVEMRKIETETQKNNDDANLLDVFEILKIKNVCCKTRLLTVREFNTFLYSNKY